MLNRAEKVVVISSVSGGGKTTLIQELKKLHPHIHVAVTATSRGPREGEIPGDHYYFYEPERFRNMIEKGEFLEYAEVHGNLYGVPKGPVEERLKQGTPVILNIDVQGMRTVKQKLGAGVVTIFLIPPDEEVWEKRLRQRGSDPEEEIQRRLRIGREELARADDFDYRVLNDRLDRAVGEVESILRKEGIL